MRDLDAWCSVRRRVSGDKVLAATESLTVTSKASVGIENRLYLASRGPGAATEYCNTIVESRIMFSAIIGGQAIG
jgi:hypothetical protein